MLFLGAFSESVHGSCFLAEIAELAAPGGYVPVHLSFLAADVYSVPLTEACLQHRRGGSWSPSYRRLVFEVMCASLWNCSGGSQRIAQMGKHFWTSTSCPIPGSEQGQLHQVDQHLALMSFEYISIDRDCLCGQPVPVFYHCHSKLFSSYS